MHSNRDTHTLGLAARLLIVAGAARRQCRHHQHHHPEILFFHLIFRDSLTNLYLFNGMTMQSGSHSGTSENTLTQGGQLVGCVTVLWWRWVCVWPLRPYAMWWMGRIKYTRQWLCGSGRLSRARFHVAYMKHRRLSHFTALKIRYADNNKIISDTISYTSVSFSLLYNVVCWRARGGLSMSLLADEVDMYRLMICMQQNTHFYFQYFHHLFSQYMDRAPLDALIQFTHAAVVVGHFH